MNQPRFYGLAVLIALACLLVVPVSAQENPTLPINEPLAAITAQDLQIYVPGQSPVQVTTTDAGNSIYSPLWTGDVLAYTNRDLNTSSQTLVATDLTGSEPRQLATDLASGFPISTDESGNILFAVATGEYTDQTTGPAQEITPIYTVSPTGGAAPTEIGTINFGVGCGGGSAFPADWQYWAESGFGGNRLTLETTPYGIVHSVNCSGAGIALLNPETDEDIVLDPFLSRTVLSPEGNRLLGVTNGMLTLVNLETREITALPQPSEVVVDQVAWGAAGTNEIFYSTRGQIGQVELTAEQQGQLTDVLGFETPIPIWEVTINRFNMDTGEDTEVYSAEAYAIGRMWVTPDNGSLMFSQIPNLNTWVNGLLDGTIDRMSQTGMQQETAAVATELYRVSLADTASVELVGTDLSQAAMQTQ